MRPIDFGRRAHPVDRAAMAAITTFWPRTADTSPRQARVRLTAAPWLPREYPQRSGVEHRLAILAPGGGVGGASNTLSLEPWSSATVPRPGTVSKARWFQCVTQRLRRSSRRYTCVAAGGFAPAVPPRTPPAVDRRHGSRVGDGRPMPVISWLRAPSRRCTSALPAACAVPAGCSIASSPVQQGDSRPAARQRLCRHRYRRLSSLRSATSYLR